MAAATKAAEEKGKETKSCHKAQGQGREAGKGHNEGGTAGGRKEDGRVATRCNRVGLGWTRKEDFLFTILVN